VKIQTSKKTKQKKQTTKDKNKETTFCDQLRGVAHSRVHLAEILCAREGHEQYVPEDGVPVVLAIALRNSLEEPKREKMAKSIFRIPSRKKKKDHAFK
jgi:hypothetical protein